jgi:hypothetical protein
MSTFKEEPAAQPPVVAYTIAEFCRAHRFSQAYYYELRASGRGPREMKVGSRRIISAEAAAEWRREREAAD